MADLDKQLNLPEREEKILDFWKVNGVFEKSLEKTRKGKTFVFYEGPPYANGLPGIHHFEARVFKDIIIRYRTMRGFYVPRKAGWDTHGLPIEMEVEKKLGLKSKKDIEEKVGIAKFVEEAQKSVFLYKSEWERFTERIGYWLDLANAYMTMSPEYIETLWWIIKEIWEKGLLYQDFKVLPWCPRCETALSSHEVGQGYKTVKDRSVYVKFKLKKGQKIKDFVTDNKTYILAWTTTPWTLPGNVALAVGSSIKYLVLSIEGTDEKFILAKDLADRVLNTKYIIHDTVLGKELVGLEYEPLFDVPQLKYDKSYRIYEADFVSTGEGTGVVHTALMYGEDDYKLGQKYELPAFHTVTEEGRFIDTLGDGLAGLAVKDPKTEEKIISALKKRNFLLKEEPYEHEYPFCWRCGNPLLYYARKAWWIKTTAVKKELLANNEKINWTPLHLKKGRFGEFLREVRDWALSRERYWGTPLPIWQCVKCEHAEVIGSREELARRAGKSKNRYFIMRHGEALSNVKNIASYEPKDGLGETLKGRIQAERAARKLKREGIDKIFSSDIPRVKETAEIAARILKIPKVVYDKRLREINTGIFGGRPVAEYRGYFSSMLEKFSKRPPQGENLADVRKRVLEFIQELEEHYSGKTILVVGHEYPLWMLYAGALGFSDEEAVAFREGKRQRNFIEFAEVIEVLFKNLPRDESGAVNLHRPYVDELRLECGKCKGDMERVPEVADVWFDSGSMPWASRTDADLNIADRRGKILRESALNFGPRKSAFLFPADYICEAVDQTRGWFYTLLAVSTLLGKGAPYKNVISLGLVLDKNGQKMSKSKGNIVEPWFMMEKYGADSIRWYFYTINAPGDPKWFDEKDVQQKLRGFINTFWNVFIFFDTYADKISKVTLRQARGINNSPRAQSRGYLNILDHWILIKLDNLISEVTERLDSYDITSSARSIENFVISDFSQWYVRRSRGRFQLPQSVQEKEEAAAVMGYVLLSLCKLSAPFTPFFSEIIYQELRKKLGLKELSMHLASWPKPESRIKNQELRILKNMETVREIVAKALKLRAEAGIKVRQPLRELRIKNQELRGREELLDLIKDEVNVKEITFGKEMKLDTEITPELKEEGIVREIVRNLQEMRRDLGLKPKDKIIAQFSAGQDFVAILEKWKKMLNDRAGIRQMKTGGKITFKAKREVMLDGKKLIIAIR